MRAICFSILVFFFLSTRALTAEDDDILGTDLKVIPFKKVTKKGLTFRVPDDMPFVEKDGILKPIEFEEYFYSKIKKLETQIDDLMARIRQAQSAVEKLEKNVEAGRSKQSEDAQKPLPG
ncbi:MAG: hypothetical protein HY587_01710 [Candidatus Omnitrophica bacterium]|nr:hypothetical protein [Candidatus Omnitrophota bacterium]